MSGAESHNAQENEINHSAPNKSPECPVCLQTCLQPISLPCSHIFCFLCAKGIAGHSRKCALCRKRIPDGYLNSPVVIEDPTPPVAIDGKYQWFYQGSDGWWQYDPRISCEIEASYKESQESLKIMIAGFMYIVDLEKMIQYRENIPSRVRRIKRDLIDIPDKKGVAGLPLKKFLAPREAGAEKSEDVKTVTSSSTSNDLATSLGKEISDSLNEISESLSELSLSDNNDTKKAKTVHADDKTPE